MNFSPVDRTDLHVHTSSHTDIAKDGGKAFRAFKALCFGIIADFAEKLSLIPEPATGGSMLDNTIIVVRDTHSQDCSLCRLVGRT